MAGTEYFHAFEITFFCSMLISLFWVYDENEEAKQESEQCE